MMHPAVETRVEGRRGCGYRKVGGLYLISDGPVGTCGRLPILDKICDHCDRNYLDFTRNMMWIGSKVIKALAQECPTPSYCESCGVQSVIDDVKGRHVLLWVGAMFYPTPGHFIAEAQRTGVYWSHALAEFRSAIEAAGFEIVAAREAYRGNSDLVVARKPPAANCQDFHHSSQELTP